MLLRLICTERSLENGPGRLVSGKSYRLGRSSKCSFVVADGSVSRFHAEIKIGEATIRVKDLSSRNGTFVDGVRVEDAEVKPGQALRFGAVQFQLIAYEGASRNGHEVSEASTYFVRPQLRPMPAAVDQLSKAERRVLDELLTGLSEMEAAANLKLSPHTVHNHVKAIYRKLEVNSRAELLALFVAGEKAAGK